MSRLFVFLLLLMFVVMVVAKPPKCDFDSNKDDKECKDTGLGWWWLLIVCCVLSSSSGSIGGGFGTDNETLRPVESLEYLVFVLSSVVLCV
ncbi:hypothetical protein M3Y94_01095200 [Aphelenchoides besseyi]|nr:hypothetical protein M3Y94_01095200 [Aphelenchoides besseyi]